MTITLKNVPPRLHEELKVRAQIHGCDLNTEIIACLESVVSSGEVDVESILQSARRVRNSMKVALTNKDLLGFKNEGRTGRRKIQSS